MLEEAYQRYPNYWFEISVWHGGQKQIDWYADHGQTYTPDRYGGMVQFGLWLLRPRVARYFAFWHKNRNDALTYFMPVAEAVESVYRSQVLKLFWREGKLVENPARKHQAGLPKLTGHASCSIRGVLPRILPVELSDVQPVHVLS